MKKTKVMFMAWGFSIHAKRRIQLFIDDPAFEVAVVSTHNYDFGNARNYLLTQAVESKKTTNIGSAKEKATGVIKQLRTRLLPLYRTISRTASLLLLPLSEYRMAKKDYEVLKTSVKAFGPEVVFLQTLLYPNYLSFFLPRSVPLIITFWNGDVIWWAKWTGIERLLKKQIVTYGARRAAAITVNSRMAFNACLGYGAKMDRIHLIPYPGVDMERFKPLAKEDARRRLGITASKVVLCPRGLGGYLNSDIIVEAVAAVVKKYSDTLFIFLSEVGGETQWERHLQRARKLGIEKNIRRDGQISWETMPLYYNSADVMVSMSSNDSLPNCMLESMACGVPVIMGDIPQIREWIVDGKNGFLVPARDQAALAKKIIRIFDNENGSRDSFVAESLSLVRERVDSKKNTAIIKSLVRNIAESAAGRDGINETS